MKSYLQKRIPHSFFILIAATCPILVYLYMLLVVAMSTVSGDFRGFFISKSLRISELRLPAWDSYRGPLIPGDRVIAVNGENVHSLDDVRHEERRATINGWTAYEVVGLHGNAKTVTLQTTTFNENDLLLTFGTSAVCVVLMFLCCLLGNIHAPPTWQFCSWLYVTTAGLWILGYYDYYTTYLFSIVTVLAGVMVVPAALHFNMVVCQLPKQRFLLPGAITTSFLCFLFHRTFLNTSGTWDTISYLACWMNGFIWASFLAWRLWSIGRSSEMTHDRIYRVRVVLFSQAVFCGIPLILRISGFLFQIRVPADQFVFLFMIPLFPISVAYIAYHDRIYEQLKVYEKKLATRERFISLGVLSAGLAHEINNPLHALSLNAAILKKTLQAPVENTKEFRTTLNRITKRVLKSVARINTVVNGINSFARHNLKVQPNVDLESLVQSAVTQVKRQYPQKEVSVNISLHGLTHIDIAPGALSQVMVNLLANAFYAVGPDGHVSVDARRDERELRISVTDDGPGISEEIRNHIFEPFFTTKDTGVGMGLGLWISSQLIAAHGGRIELHATIAKGTHFEVILPQNNHPSIQIEPTPSQSYAPQMTSFI